MAVALLDVNVLVALFDDGHVHHQIAHEWFDENGEHGWASSAITENAFVRILSNPTRVDDAVAISTLVSLLRTFCEHSRHQFWPEDISLRDDERFDVDAIRGHQRITDVYLLGLAVK